MVTNPCPFGGTHVNKVATYPMPPWGSLKRGPNQMATCGLPSEGPTSGQSGYLTIAVVAVPEVGMKTKMATYPLTSWGPKFGKVTTSPLPS